MTKAHADLLSDVVDDDDAVSPSVVAGGDGSKPLLTCCVPLKDTQRKMVSPDSRAYLTRNFLTLFTLSNNKIV